MLYIFHVDTGTMLSLDMNLALEDGHTLKEELKKITGIPIDKQVLLASGGESLEAKSRVCSYSAGTDTNPIYLFSKESIGSPNPPTATSDHVPNADLSEEFEAALKLPPTIGTVMHRCTLGLQIYEKGKAFCRICEKLVHDQLLQHQGWAAVMANLEDVLSGFALRSESFELNYKEYLESRQDYLPMLESFSKDVALLAKIPIIPGLEEVLENSDKQCDTSSTGASVEAGGDEDKVKSCTESESSRKTLLQWISEKDNQYSVDEVAEHCRRGLEQFNESILEEIKSEVKGIIEMARKPEHREIKGLEDRLFGLDKLKTEIIEILQEQTSLAQAFHHSQQKASKYSDPSALPDLCASHKCQLITMHKHHNRLRDIKRRCLKAKQELVTSLHHGLKWVMFVESKISETELKLMMYNEYLKRLRRQLSVLQQLHVAANIYVNAVVEVLRRQAFSQAFLMWANDLACHLCAIHSEEVARRNNFHAQFDGHFLTSLFPGFEDMPPPFATQPPDIFDDNLPKVTIEDIDALKTLLPELASSLTLPDSSVTQFFLSRSAILLKPEPTLPSASIEDKIEESVTAPGLSSNLDPALQLPTDSSQSVGTTTQPISSDRGFESETDTEEFEKVGQIPCDSTVKVQAQESSTKGELFLKMEKINSSVGETVSELKTDVGHLKQWILCERTELEGLISQLQGAWSTQNLKLKEELAEREEAIQKLVENQIKLESDLRSFAEERDTAKAALEAKMKEEARKVAERLAKVKAQQLASQKQAIHSVSESSQVGSPEVERTTAKAVSEAKIKEEAHKSSEVAKSKAKQSTPPRQAIRSISESQLGSHEERVTAPAASEARVKDETPKSTERLVKSRAQQSAPPKQAIRSISESQLGSCEKSFLKEKKGLCEINEDLNLAREMVMFQDSEMFEAILSPSLTVAKSYQIEGPVKIVLGGDSVTRLRTESSREQLSDSSVYVDASVVDKSLVLKSEIPRSSVSTKSVHNVSPSSSIVTIDASSLSYRDAATSPEPSPRKCRVSKEKLSESTNSLIQQGKINVGSCTEGDIVLVIWDENFGTYTILQESSSYTYFLHLDSLCALGLRDELRSHKSKILSANPRKQYAIGEVVSKEFCQAKKAENRYNVPVGSRFYRVKVRPQSAKPHAPSTISTGVQSS